MFGHSVEQELWMRRPGNHLTSQLHCVPSSPGHALIKRHVTWTWQQNQVAAHLNGEAAGQLLRTLDDDDGSSRFVSVRDPNRVQRRFESAWVLDLRAHDVECCIQDQAIAELRESGEVSRAQIRRRSALRIKSIAVKVDAEAPIQGAGPSDLVNGVKEAQVVLRRVPWRIAEQSNARRIGADCHVDGPAVERHAYRSLDHTSRIWFEPMCDVCVCIELRSSPMIALRTCQQQSSTASTLGWNMFGGELLRFDGLPKERLESVPCYAERTDVQRADVMRKMVAHDSRTRRGERLRAAVEPCLSSFQ